MNIKTTLRVTEITIYVKTNIDNYKGSTIKTMINQNKTRQLKFIKNKQ
jgi:hypothetical protein